MTHQVLKLRYLILDQKCILAVLGSILILGLIIPDHHINF